MSNKTQLQTNNTALDSLISRVNAAKDVAASLPEAGGSDGGGSAGTCTIIMSSGSISNCEVFYQCEGAWDICSPDTFTVDCDSIITVSQGGYYGVSISDGSLLYESTGTGFVYQTPNTPGATVTIDIEVD